MAKTSTHRPSVGRGFRTVVVLMLLRMLVHFREMDEPVRWAVSHWERRFEPLGFNRYKPPCATTISRAVAKCSVADFQKALAGWF